MSEPTIDEMAEYFAAQLKIEHIRAFIERVEKRLPDYDTGRGADEWLKHYHRAVKDELAAMEKEAE